VGGADAEINAEMEKLEAAIIEKSKTGCICPAMRASDAGGEGRSAQGEL